MPETRDTALTRILLPVLFLGIVLALVGTVGTMLEPTSFERFLGPLHPALAIGIATLAAMLALPFLVRRYGFALLGPGASRRGMLSAAALAVLFAVGAIVADLALRYPETINVVLPEAFFLYPAMALIVEFLFHASLLALLLLLLRPVFTRMGEGRTVWAAIVLVALAEPIVQVVLEGTLSWTELYTVVSVFLFGVVQLALFRRYGFLTMLAMRLFYYLLWHIAWGHLRLDLLF